MGGVGERSVLCRRDIAGQEDDELLPIETWE